MCLRCSTGARPSSTCAALKVAAYLHEQVALWERGPHDTRWIENNFPVRMPLPSVTGNRKTPAAWQMDPILNLPFRGLFVLGSGRLNSRGWDVSL